MVVATTVWIPQDHWRKRSNEHHWIVLYERLEGASHSLLPHTQECSTRMLVTSLWRGRYHQETLWAQGPLWITDTYKDTNMVAGWREPCWTSCWFCLWLWILGTAADTRHLYLPGCSWWKSFLCKHALDFGDRQELSALWLIVASPLVTQSSSGLSMCISLPHSLADGCCVSKWQHFASRSKCGGSWGWGVCSLV